MENLIIATSEKGKTYEYEVEVIAGEEPRVSLGFPMQWYIAHIKEPPRSGDDRMYIDVGGRNHDGSATSISHVELMTIIEKELSNQP